MSEGLFQVKDKVIVITGGAGALGGSMAGHLVEQGAKVVILSRSQESVDKKLKGIQTTENCIGFACDVLSIDDLESVKDKILSKWGAVDGLINAAGGNLPGATISPDQTFFDLKMPDFNQVTSLNLQGTVLPCMVFGKVMADRKAGVIINISSMASQQAITRVVGYSAAKAAIDNFTRWLATEMALKYGDKIRVNAVSPGFFIGKQNKKLLLNDDGSHTERGKSIILNTPMRRFGEANELHGVVQFLLSEASGFVTGTTIAVDGGFSVFSGV